MPSQISPSTTASITISESCASNHLIAVAKACFSLFADQIGGGQIDHSAKRADGKTEVRSLRSGFTHQSLYWANPQEHRPDAPLAFGGWTKPPFAHDIFFGLRVRFRHAHQVAKHRPDEKSLEFRSDHSRIEASSCGQVRLRFLGSSIFAFATFGTHCK